MAAPVRELLRDPDIGVRTATALLDGAREKVKRRELDDPARLKAALRQEIARIVAFLASDDAGFITGSTLSANGGQYMI